MKICVDPGHGMSNRQIGIFDSGATHTENSFLFREADLALGYALALKDTFRARGVDVFMTRDDATDHAPVGKRAAMAKNAGCDVFISLHLNDFDDDSANGLEVLFRDAQDKALAQKLQDALVKVTKIRDRRIKQRTDLAVLKFQGVAVLVELGFIANDGDRATLLDAQIREAVVREIATVTMEHMGGNA
jgi:N-acetylmuramoyl-L-alanine amidase